MYRTVMERTGGRCSSIARPLVGVAFVLAIFIGRNVLAADTQDKTVMIKPISTYQVMIGRTLSCHSEEEMRKELEALKQKDGPQYRTLIPQLLYYSMHGTDEEGKRDVREAMALGIIVKSLRIPDYTLAAALVPYLETADPDLQEALGDVLASIDYSRPPGRRDYSHYQTILEHSFRRSKEPPLGLIRYMYRMDSGAALLTVMRASLRASIPREREQIRQILWAEHEIADVLWKHKHRFLEPDQVESSAKKELEELSRSERWWARLYVAEILRQHPGFRQPEFIDRLKHDKHLLVRKAIEAFAEKTD